MDILVVGAGAMGRWMGHSLVDDGPESVELAFVDTDADAALDAADAVAGRAVATDTDETFDGVCVAVPIPAATATIAEYADRAAASTLLWTAPGADLDERRDLPVDPAERRERLPTAVLHTD